MKVFYLFLFSLFLFNNTVNAEVDSSRRFDFNGQEQELCELQQMLTETRYRTEEVDDTCTRQVPYDSYEC